jgi:gamma-tubulin complex component 5
MQWSDFHFMNSAFRDAAEAVSGKNRWIDSNLIRLSYKKQMHTQPSNRSVQAVHGLTVEYAVPFPLTYICGPKALRRYGDVFTLLLQIRRAKVALELTLARGGDLRSPNLKVFYATRAKLTWFLKFAPYSL